MKHRIFKRVIALVLSFTLVLAIFASTGVSASVANWQMVLNSPYVSPNGAGGTEPTVTATADGIVVTNRGDGQHDNNRGVFIDVAGLRARNAGDIVISGNADAGVTMMLQGTGVSSSAGDDGSFTLTIGAAVDISIPGWAGWASAPFLATGAIGEAEQPDFTITEITLGGTSIFEVLGGAAATPTPTPPTGHAPGIPVPTSLKQAFDGHFMIGTVWHSSWRHPNMGSTEVTNFVRYHFNAITAEDYMKVDQLLGAVPNSWTWNWTRADRLVDWSSANDIEVIGHALVWHSQSRSWLTSNTNNQPLTRAQAIANMEQFINTVAGRYRGRIYSWDVVNEAITTGVGSFSGDWRNHLRKTTSELDGSHTQWYNAFANGATGDECGSDFIYYAFRFARLADPNAILYYNDFNEEQPGKRDAIAQMVTQVNQRWTNDPLYDGRLLIEVIGMQSHYHAVGPWATNFAHVRQAMQAFVNTGARISITELDITVGGGWSGGPATQAPATAAQLPGLFQTQANLYARLFGYYIEFAEHINRVSFWGFTDSHGWRSPGFPLIFNEDLSPKPAFYSIMEVAAANPVGVPVPTPTPTPAATPPPTPTPTPTPEPEPEPPGQAAPVMRFVVGVPSFYNRGFTAPLEAAPFIADDRTMVPFRAIAEGLGADIDWIEATRTVVFVLDGTTASLSIGVPLPDNMGVPVIVEGRTFVPVRYVSEVLGATVEWNPATRAVYIYQ